VVYLAELYVCLTVRFPNYQNAECAVRRVHGHKLLDDDATGW